MPNKIDLKTSKNTSSVSAYVASIGDDASRRDAKALLKLFKAVTGAKARMWGGSIVGYGEYTYFRSNGGEGEYLATGFSMRKSGPTIYIMPGYRNYSALLSRLGPHKLGKSCLYLKRVEGIDLDVLAELIRTGIADLNETHAVRMR